MAKGIEKFIESVCVQTAIYWGNPVNDGYGGMSFDYPTEIKVRWEWKETLITTSDGKEFRSKAEVLVTEDLTQQGMLYLGKIEDLFPLDIRNTNPKNIDGAWEIQAVEKTPMIKTTDVFVRKVYLASRSI